jgi:hypothetical protein
LAGAELAGDPPGGGVPAHFDWFPLTPLSHLDFCPSFAAALPGGYCA